MQTVRFMEFLELIGTETQVRLKNLFTNITQTHCNLITEIKPGMFCLKVSLSMNSAQW